MLRPRLAVCYQYLERGYVFADCGGCWIKSANRLEISNLSIVMSNPVTSVIVGEREMDYFSNYVYISHAQDHSIQNDRLIISNIDVLRNQI